jgi:hypothetical protein
MLVNRTVARSAVALVAYLLLQSSAGAFQPDLSTVLHYITHSPTARCLDGTPPSFYVRRGYGSGLHKWVIFFEGGGWCYDMEQCYLRSKTELGSSGNNPPHKVSPLYLSGEGHLNPLMHNWNSIHVEYCDGSSFAGDAVHTFQVAAPCAVAPL